MSRGLIFGTAVDQAYYLDPGDGRYIPGLLDAALLHADIWSFSNDFQPNSVQNSQGSFSLSPARNAIARALANDKLWRLHLLVYPAHDMPWINSGTLTSATYKSIIDAHLNALATIQNVQTAFNIDVTNEIFDGNNTLPGGYRPNQWYTASAPGSVTSSAPIGGIFDGPDWVAYLFLKARQLWPSTPLFLCHDQMEQITSSYHVNHNANILNFLTKGLAAGLPIDGLNMQGHLSIVRGFDAVALKAFLTSVKALGLKLMIGELDCRTGDDSFAAYTPYEYDRRCSDLLKRFLDVALPFVDVGQPVVSWGMSDIKHPWPVGERPLPLDANYQPKRQYDTIRQSLEKAQ